MDSSPDDQHGPDLGLPDTSDNTLAKIACIEEMLNRMQNVPHAPDIFLQEMLGLVNKEDVSKMVEVQNHMLSRFEKTNEMLLNFNSLSMSRYETTCQEFKRHTHLLTQMKKDLDNVFKRIRTVKSKLNKEHPEAFQATKMPRQLTEEDEEDIDNQVTDESQSLPSANVSTASTSSSRQSLKDRSKSTEKAKIPNKRLISEHHDRSLSLDSKDYNVNTHRKHNIAKVISGED